MTLSLFLEHVKNLAHAYFLNLFNLELIDRRFCLLALAPRITEP